MSPETFDLTDPILIADRLLVLEESWVVRIDSRYRESDPPDPEPP